MKNVARLLSVLGITLLISCAIPKHKVYQIGDSKLISETPAEDREFKDSKGFVCMTFKEYMDVLKYMKSCEFDPL